MKVVELLKDSDSGLWEAIKHTFTGDSVMNCKLGPRVSIGNWLAHLVTYTTRVVTIEAAREDYGIKL